MTSVTIGDMARTALLRRETTTLKASIQDLTAELTTGRRADLPTAVAGDFRTLSGLEHSIATLRSYGTATTEAALFTQTVQTALETTQNAANQISPAINQAASGGGSTLIATTSIQARQQFFSAISALNARVGDRYVLSGAATDAMPVADGQMILDDLSAAIAGQMTGAGVADAVEAWFDAPPGGGGFADKGYGGAATLLRPFALGDGTNVEMKATALDPRVRDTLKGLALGALVSEGALAGDSTGQALILKRAGEVLMTADGNLIDLRAEIGAAEGHIETIRIRNANEQSALEIARTGIIATDPYDTATQLETARSQLEMMFSLTARLADLNLASFLR